MAFDFGTFVNSMQNVGIFQYLFPFLLALAVVYGTLMYALGDKIKKGPVGLISIVLSFFVMLYASSEPMIVNFFATLGGTTLIVASGLLVIVILMGLAGFKLHEVFSGEYMKWFLIFAIILIGIILFFGAGGGGFINVPGFIINSEFTTFIIVILIIAAAMWFMTREEKAPAAPAGGKKE